MKHTFLCIFLFMCLKVYSMENVSKKNVKTSSATELCLAGIANGSLKQVKRGLKKGANVNHIDEHGNSLFALAFSKKTNINHATRDAIVTLLVSQKNINPCIRNFNNATPLHAACQFGMIKIIQKMLKKAPSLIDARTKQGHSPFHAAVFYQQIEAIKLLLTHNKEIINVQDYDGDTALHFTCAEKQFDIITLLTEYGAQTTIKNNNHNTALYSLYAACYPDDLKRLETFLTSNPFVAEKLMYATDEHKNNQLHLCSTLELSHYHTIKNYVSFLISKNLSLHARNKQGQRVVDLIYNEYYISYNQYFFHKKNYYKLIVDNAEKYMHVFLFFISSFTECALFKNVLEEKAIDNKGLLKEIKSYIAYLYYALNIETIIAKKYINDAYYYNDFLENKNDIKQNLITNPEPHLLWSV